MACRTRAQVGRRDAATKRLNVVTLADAPAVFDESRRFADPGTFQADGRSAGPRRISRARLSGAYRCPQTSCAHAATREE